VASAKVINITTKIQPTATMCISDYGTQYHLLKNHVIIG